MKKIYIVVDTTNGEAWGSLNTEYEAQELIERLEETRDGVFALITATTEKHTIEKIEACTY